IVMSTNTITLAPGDGFPRPGSFLDPGADTWTATVDYGDGTGSHALSLTGKTFGLASPAYTAGDHTVTVTIKDDDGGVDIVTFHVKVSSPPKLTAVANQTATKNSPLSLNFSFMAPASTPGYPYSINWGDPSSGTANVQTGGSVTTDPAGQGTFSGSHTYKHKGTYLVYVTVADPDAGSDTISFQVTVS